MFFISQKTDKSWMYDNCELVRVIDGDTVILKLKATYQLNIDFGFYVKDTVSLSKEAVINFRLAGIDTPEVVGKEKAEGLIAKEEVIRLFDNAKDIRVESFKTDKYGRWLAKVYLTPNDGQPEIDLVGYLIEHGYGEPYGK